MSLNNNQTHLQRRKIKKKVKKNNKSLKILVDVKQFKLHIKINKHNNLFRNKKNYKIY